MDALGVSDHARGEYDIGTDDLQAQADVMYASILASVDMIMEREAAAAGGVPPTSKAVDDTEGQEKYGERAASQKAQAVRTPTRMRSESYAEPTRTSMCSHACAGTTPAEGGKPTCSTPGNLRDGPAIAPRSQQRFPPSTFGSSRKGISEPVRKNTSPGPGSYFVDDDANANRLRCRGAEVDEATQRDHNRSSERADKRGERAKQKEDRGELRRRQMGILCQCYWKQMPDIDAPKNPAAHAADCPCQSMRVVYGEVDDDRFVSSSGSSSRDCDGPRSCAKKGGIKRKVSNSVRERVQVSPSVVSPRLVGRFSSRGAIFGTSPRRTIFAGDTPDSNTCRRNMSRQRGADSGEGGLREDPPAVRSSDGGGGTPSYLKSTKRTDCASRRGTPGPGSYDVLSAFGGASVSLAKKNAGGAVIGRAERKLHTSNNVPGPGAYDTDRNSAVDTRPRKSSGTLPTNQRQLSLLPSKDVALTPGPGEYYLENVTLSDARHKSPPAFSFNRAKLLRCGKVPLTASPSPEEEEVPGPGTYDIATTPASKCAASAGRSAVITNAKRSGLPWDSGRASPDEVPGPGAYEPIVRESSPAHFIGHKPEEHAELTPGPGQYELPQISSGPQWSLPSRRSPPPEHQPTPGPGDYCVPANDWKCLHSTAPIFSTAPRVLHEGTKDAEMHPGPGAYDTEGQGTTARAAVMGTAQRIPPFGFVCDPDVPGPGTYTAIYTAQEPRVVSPLLGAAAPRFDEDGDVSSCGIVYASQTPGPGYYDTNCGEVVSRGHSVTFGNAPRTSPFDHEAAGDGPGPGAYDTVIPKDSPSFSMGRRLDISQVSDTAPGPGEYDPQDPTMSSRNVAIGGAPRFQTTGEERDHYDVPGPGTYTAKVPQAHTEAALFGTEPRLLNAEASTGYRDEDSGLGPGSYDPQMPQTDKYGAAWGTGPRFADGVADDIPGPGAYDIQQDNPPTKVVNFELSCGKPRQWAESTDTNPGPGAYAPRNPRDRTAPGVVFGSSPQYPSSPVEREALTRPGVGPGSYDVTLPTAHVFHTTFGGASDARGESSQQHELVIGPGHYDPHGGKPSLSRSAVFGVAPRVPSQESSCDVPGPGAYSLASVSGAGQLAGPVTFAKAQRFDITGSDPQGGDDSSPGPGHYTVEAHGAVAASAGAPTFAKGPRVLDFKEREHTLLPGPGQYHIDGSGTRADGVAYSFGTGPRVSRIPDDADSLTPGPGAYDVGNSTLAVSGPRFGFEPRASEYLGYKEGPGPGAYSVELSSLSSPASPAYSFPIAKRETQSPDVSSSPGPGQYDCAAEDLNHPHAGAARFPVGARFAEGNEGKESPGPGQYTPYHPQWSGLPAHSFPAGERSTSVNERGDGPGPGTYSPKLPLPAPTAALFGTEPRHTSGGMSETDGHNHPGPGHYSPAMLEDSPSIRFSTAPRGVEKACDAGDTPGPGTYDVRGVYHEGVGYSFGRAATQLFTASTAQNTDVPGPGTYSVPPTLASAVGGPVSGSFVKAARFPNVDFTQREGPGPGAYSVPPTQLTTGPFIGKAPRLVAGGADREELPGPGHYEVSDGNLQGAVDGSVTMRFTSERFRVPGGGVSSDTPGPGSYSPMEAKGTKDGAAFSQAPRHVASELSGGPSQPGPGEYDVSSAWNATTTSNVYSFGTEPRMKVNTPEGTTPGPGSYDASLCLDRHQAGPSFTLKGKEMQNGNDVDLPGPGAYDACRYMNECLGGPAFTIRGKPAPRENIVNDDAPGPGTYEVNRYLDQLQGGPSFTLRGKPPPAGVDVTNVPGPGSYDVNGSLDVLRAGPSFSLRGKPVYLVENDADSPGPGSYDTNLYLERCQPGPAFTLRGKGACNAGGNSGDTPGPGSYDVNSYLERCQAGPSFTFKGRPSLADADSSAIPGPGCYDAQRYVDQSQIGPLFTIRGKRAYTGQSDTVTPGPGSYDANLYLERRQAGLTFGVGGRGSLNGVGEDDDAPGPGAYDANRYLEKYGGSPAFTMRGKPVNNDDNQAANAPGPGNYDASRYLEQSQSGPAFTLKGRSKQDGDCGGDAPGPGSYDANRYLEQYCTGPSFSLKGKLQCDVSCVPNNPGPGSYDVDRYMGQFMSGPAYTMKGKLESNGGNDSFPGPGSYDANRYLEQYQAGPTFTLKGKASNVGCGPDVPGPGSYDANRYLEQCQSGPSFTMKGKPVCTGVISDDAPGPGSYNVERYTEQYKSGPAFTMAGRPVDSSISGGDVPGPGCYDAERYMQQYVSGPAFTLKGKPAYGDGHKAEDFPGPGAYHPRPQEAIRTVSFGVLPTVDPATAFEAQVNATPGPAAYDIPSTLSGKATSFSAAERKSNRVEDTPGPGAYMTGGPIVVLEGPAFTFGKEPRSVASASTQQDSVGPGAYHHPIEAKPPAPAFTFALADRFVEPQASAGTGPGAYYHPYPGGTYGGSAFTFPRCARVVTGTVIK